MSNISTIIFKHNKALLAHRTEPANTMPLCNCRAKASYPIKRQCCKRSIIYKTTLTSGGIANNYYGCCEPEYKTRFYNYNQSFKYQQKCNAIEVSKALWQAKDAGQNRVTKWSIATCTTPYYKRARWCNLCLAEKLIIFRADPTTTLNKKVRTDQNSELKMNG